VTVVELKPGNLPDEPYAGVVETLERLLADAKSGNLRAIAYAVVRTQNVQATGWDGAAGTRHPMSGAIMILAHRYAEALHAGRAFDE
jgi:hypothetical protein